MDQFLGRHHSGFRVRVGLVHHQSKELIGGFVLLQARSRDAVLEWASRFAKVYGDVEMDLRPVAEAHAEAGGLAFDAAT